MQTSLRTKDIINGGPLKQLDDIKTQSILSQPNINMSLNKVSVLGASPSQFNPTLAVSDCLCARSGSPISGGTVRLSLCLSVCAFSVCVSLSLSCLVLFLSRVSSESSSLWDCGWLFGTCVERGTQEGKIFVKTVCQIQTTVTFQVHVQTASDD